LLKGNFHLLNVSAKYDISYFEYLISKLMVNMQLNVLNISAAFMFLMLEVNRLLSCFEC